jgi:hypothetical protein
VSSKLRGPGMGAAPAARIRFRAMAIGASRVNECERKGEKCSCELRRIHKKPPFVNRCSLKSVVLLRSYAKT